MELIKDPKHGDKLDARDSMYPSLLEVIAKFTHCKLANDGAPRTTYGFVLSGIAKLEIVYAPKQKLGGMKADLQEGAYFAVPGEFKISPKGAAAEVGGEFRQPLVVLFHRYGYKGQLNIGRIEKKGRLSYIDGCSDTVLVYPARQGDPAFNHLHMPPGILQTQHTHPSVRLGLVARGSGICVVPDRNDGVSVKVLPLTQGCLFMLNEQELHKFDTRGSPEPLDIIAYHPDSDTGPTEANHPMMTKTLIGNVR